MCVDGHGMNVDGTYVQMIRIEQWNMLPSVDGNDERITLRLILVFTQLLIVASLLFSFIAHTGMLYLASAIILGICFYDFASQTSLALSKSAAKRLLHASVIYLPLLYLFMIIDRLNG